MKFRIVIVAPPGWAHAGMYRELAETLVYGFRRIGYEAETAFNAFDPGVVNVAMHAHELPPALLERLPPSTVIYNLEQIDDRTWDWAPALKVLLSRYEVWDYSQRNIARLKGLAPRICRLPIGTEPEMTRIPRAPEQDIDVLFYGTVSERRRPILQAISDAGLKLHVAFGVYGAERDALIARSKVVLNIAQVEGRVFEIVRVSYLLANRKAVVSEVSETTDMEANLADAICGVRYDGLVEACRALVASVAQRRALEQRGYQRMSARRQHTYIRKLLRARQTAQPQGVNNSG